MLKSLAVLALTFYIFPMQTYAQTNKTQQTAKGDKPSPAVAVPDEHIDGPSLQSEPKNHVDANVRVISTPGKDSYDKALFWVNLTLVGVGIGGIIVASITLRKIERQTAATEEATKIAKANFDALINKDRARVRLVDEPADIAALHPDFIREKTTFEGMSPFSTDTDEFTVSIFNAGLSTARDVQATISVIIRDKAGNALWSDSRVMNLGDIKQEAEPIALTIGLFLCLPDETLGLIHAEEALVQFSGTIYYRDAYLPDRRITGFKYLWKVEEDDIDLGDGQIAHPDISRWIISREPGSNHQT